MNKKTPKVERVEGDSGTSDAADAGIATPSSLITHHSSLPLVIVNPASAGGATGKAWPRVARHQGYQGSRFSFGYPACPNLEDQTKLFRLLDPSRIDVSLTEEFQLEPEQSTSAIIVHHEEAKYFSID